MATLQPPKSGRSRFSKALPAPPALPTFEFESDLDLTLAPLVPEKAPPRPQPQGPLPPIPPPKRAEIDRAGETTMAAMVQPPNSPLPPVPPKVTGPSPSLRSIPRRPVAAPVTPVPALAPPSAPAQARAPPDLLPSPVGSISDFLSAYSDNTDESPRSSTNPPKDASSSKSAYTVVSPSLHTQSSPQSGAATYAFPSPPSDRNTQKQPNGPVFQAHEDLPPPPPLKDSQRNISRPQTPTASPIQTAQPSTSAKVGSPLGNGSPQQDQLWRRRSLKVDKSLAVPDLKLVSSHGSTAASAQTTTQEPSSLFSEPFPLPPRSNPEAFEPAATSRAPPRTLNGGLPGRNIRPVPDQTAPSGEASMGQEASRIKEKLGSGRRRGSGGSGGSGGEPEVKKQEAQVQAPAMLSPTPSSTVSPLSAPRLPTPEYGTNDVRSPLPDAMVSPLSPASSPGLTGEPKPVGRKPIGAAEAELHHARSNASLVVEPATTGLGIRTPVFLPSSPRPGANQGPSQTQFPASPAPERNQIPEQAQSPPSAGPGGNQPQYLAYSPAPTGNPSPNEKQYTPYSPPADRNQGPTPTQPLPNLDEERPLPPAPTQEPPAPSPASTHHANGPWAQNPNRGPLPHRTISETGSIETLKASHQQQPPYLHHPTPNPIPTLPPATTAEDDDLAPPTTTTTTSEAKQEDQENHTTNPGAALFPRGWYTPPSPSFVPAPRPLTERHYRCLTQHRYMTANKQRANPVACRTCGLVDRERECFICSACYLNVCGGCAGVLRRWKGELRGVVKEVGGLGLQG